MWDIKSFVLQKSNLVVVLVVHFEVLEKPQLGIKQRQSIYVSVIPQEGKHIFNIAAIAKKPMSPG